MSEEKIKELQERRKQINAEIKELRIRGDISEYDGEVKFPIKYSFRAEGRSTRRKKSTSFQQNKLPHTILKLSLASHWDKMLLSSGDSIFVYLGNKSKPKSGLYLVDIIIHSLEEEAGG